MYLRVNDAGTTTARIKACESMTDINGTVADFPTELQASGGLYVGKSGSGTCDWIAIASEKFIYLFTQTNQTVNYRGTLFFGDIVSNKSGDAFNTMIIAAIASLFFAKDSFGFLPVNRRKITRRV